ncbi:MAG TPA: glycosyltransferase family 2 protein [Gemmatimonadales bacterium]|nr:glycosyltransferase family 2 protein [Gemmatimonadales bacterium]
MNLILLSTYNGAAFLRPQLDSLVAQTEPDWVLLVRDDGSRDGTPSLLAEAAAADSRVRVVTDHVPGNVGPAGSFGVLLERGVALGGRRFLLADQDDVWHRDKVARQLAALAGAERELGSETPILVHSDLRVVDAELRPRHPSFLRYQGLRQPSADPLRTLLAQNFVTACAAAFNRPLALLAAPFPESAVMHDWWIALCAAAAGELRFEPDALVDYRQHGRNTVGAPGQWGLAVRAASDAVNWWSARLAIFRGGIRQAAALEARLTERGSGRADARALVREYARAFDGPRGRLRRLATVAGLGVRPEGMSRRALFWWRVALA